MWESLKIHSMSTAAQNGFWWKKCKLKICYWNVCCIIHWEQNDITTVSRTHNHQPSLKITPTGKVKTWYYRLIQPESQCGSVMLVTPFWWDCGWCPGRSPAFRHQYIISQRFSTGFTSGFCAQNTEHTVLGDKLCFQSFLEPIRSEIFHTNEKLLTTSLSPVIS